MRAVLVVVVDELDDNGAQVALVHRDDVVETFTPNGADHPFGDGIRAALAPGSGWS